MKQLPSVNIRIVWYSVLVWLVSFFISGFFVLPWYFLVLPLFVFLITALYCRNISKKQSLFGHGLLVGFVWFISVLVLDIVEIVGLDPSALYINFIDPRNYLKFPIIILVPVIYTLILESSRERVPTTTLNPV